MHSLKRGDGRPHVGIRLVALALALLTVAAPIGGVAVAQSMAAANVPRLTQDPKALSQEEALSVRANGAAGGEDETPRNREAGSTTDEAHDPEAGRTPSQEPAAASERTPTSSSNPAAASRPWYTARDLELLARLVHAEAEGEPFAGQVGVAAVVLNRVRHSRFPDTIAGVIFQPGAFEPVANGRIWEAPSSTAWQAAKAALDGWDPTGGALYFYNPAKVSGSSWIWQVHVTGRIGRHTFGWR
mgnify:CR=1 FL=1